MVVGNLIDGYSLVEVGLGGMEVVLVGTEIVLEGIVALGDIVVVLGDIVVVLEGIVLVPEGIGVAAEYWAGSPREERVEVMDVKLLRVLKNNLENYFLDYVQPPALDDSFVAYN